MPRPCVPFHHLLACIWLHRRYKLRLQSRRSSQVRSLPISSPTIYWKLCCKFLSMSLYLFLQFSVSLGLRGSLESKVSSVSFNFNDNWRLFGWIFPCAGWCTDWTTKVTYAKPNLNHFQVRYWMNPNQLYWSGVYPDRYKLSTARSICLRNCPTTVSAGNGNTSSQLSWVCDYPEGTYSGLSMRDWEQRNYDYFDLLTPDQIASSRNLTGPCYPVLFESVNCMKSSHLSTTICEGNRLDGRVDLFRDSVHEVVRGIGSIPCYSIYRIWVYSSFIGSEILCMKLFEELVLYPAIPFIAFGFILHLLIKK